MPPTTKPEQTNPSAPAVSPDAVGSVLAVPSSVYTERKETPASGIELVATYAGRNPDGSTSPGLTYDGRLLNEDLYITKSPEKSYKWCTTAGHAGKVAYNKACGWTETKDASGNAVKVGTQVLCERPKEVSEQIRAQKTEEMLRRSRLHSAQNQAASMSKESGIPVIHTESKSEL